MSYSNGLLPTSTTTTMMSSQRGLPGIGFKLTDDGNYDMNQKLIRNLECPPDVAEDDSYDRSSLQKLRSRFTMRQVKARTHQTTFAE